MVIHLGKPQQRDCGATLRMFHPPRNAHRWICFLTESIPHAQVSAPPPSDAVSPALQEGFPPQVTGEPEGTPKWNGALLYLEFDSRDSPSGAKVSIPSASAAFAIHPQVVRGLTFAVTVG